MSETTKAAPSNWNVPNVLTSLRIAAVPFFGSLYDVFVNAVARPSRVTGVKYNQVSSEFFNAVHEVLSKKAEAPASLAALSRKLDRLSRGGRW